MLQSHQTFRPVPAMKLVGDYDEKIDVGLPLLTLLRLEMSTDGIKIKLV